MMKIKFLLVICIGILGFHNELTAQEAEKIFTIYLVRHAEKEVTVEHPKDPPLTACGHERAASLAAFLSAVELEAVYSTNYTRTKDTAAPLAKAKGLETQMYDPDKLSEFAKTLIARKQDAIVIGHSNTTPQLSGLLVGEEFESMTEDIYNRIYQVVIFADQGQLQLLHSAFICE